MQPGNSAPRVLFRRYLPSSVVRSPRCEIDPDYIFDLDAICVFLCSSQQHSFHFADNRTPTIDNPCNNDACKLLHATFLRSLFRTCMSPRTKKKWKITRKSLLSLTIQRFACCKYLCFDCNSIFISCK